MSVYSENEVYEATLRYFNGDELATDVWMNKYALRDENLEFLEKTPDDMHKRLAKEYSRIEQRYENPLSYEEIYNLIKGFKYFVPAGSPMYGIGNNNSIVSLGNCYVIGHNADAYGGIVMDDHDMVQLFKRRAGVGLDLSHLRPNESSVQNSAGTSTGAASFMERYSHSTKEVAQSGRRGALMLTIDIKHPDVETFINAKLEQGKVIGANISVKVTNEFMKKVENNEDFIQTFPVDLDITRHTPFMEELFNDKIEYNKIYNLKYENGNEYKGCYAKRINAKELWNKIVLNAWQSAEPGVIFWDEITGNSPAASYGREWVETSTNPCGELPLPPYDSCRLSSLNLYSYVKNPYTKSAYFDFDLFENHVRKAQRLMDDIVDLEEEKVNKILEKIDNDPEFKKLKEIERDIWIKIKNMLLNGRRTGLGVTGLGDMLAALNIQYSNEYSLKFINKVFEVFGLNSYVSSIEMAKERGKFKEFNIEKEQFNSFIRNILEKLKTNYPDIWEMYYQYGRRNIANSTIAPTGSISILTQTTSGIEPVFMLYYKRRRKVDKDKSTKAVFKDNDGNWWEEYNVFHHKFVDWFKVTHWDRLSDKEKQEMNVKTPLEWLKSCSNELLEKYVQESPYYNATANEINYLNKVKMQGDIQKYIDHSISVTHNLPKDISKEEVSDIYFYAWKNNCKGVTIYREGSREGVLVSPNSDKSNEKDFVDVDAIKRPKKLSADIYETTVKGKKWIVSVGLFNDKPYEVFAFEKYKDDVNIKNGQKGLMVRIKRGKYQLCLDNKTCIYNVIDRMSDEEESLTRALSWGLRHGGGIKHAVEQLNKAKGDMTSFSKSIARTLKRYIKDGEYAGTKCLSCGSDNVVYKDGCEICMSCGSEKCG